MLNDLEYEKLYIHFFELDTDDLLMIHASKSYSVLTMDERDVLCDVMADRRNELSALINELKLRLRIDSTIKFKIPEEILQKIQSSTNLTEWE